jgi:hypothetical protein
MRETRELVQILIIALILLLAGGLEPAFCSYVVYWTYSSDRTAYALGGGAAWQYKYCVRPGTAKGTYRFKAVLPAGSGFLTSTSATPASVSVKLK